MKKKVFAFKARKENLLESSSGGAFFALAEAFFKNGSGRKCVFGAMYDENCNVVTKSAMTLKECEKFRGSKYAPCDYTSSFRETKEKLETGYQVLYTGIPCQVFALLHYLKLNHTDVSNLFTIDIICHGMPQKRIWDGYKQEMEKKYKGNLKAVHFRYKKTNSTEPVMVAEFSNGLLIKETPLLRSYMGLYFTYLPLKPSCYQCRFSNMQRISDITLGDFWGIEKIIPTFPSSDGVSEILVNTEKGQLLMKILHNCSDAIMQRCNSNEYIKYQHNLNKPTDKPENIDTFWNDYENNGYIAVAKKYARLTRSGTIIFNIKKFLRYIGVYSKIQRLFK